MVRSDPAWVEIKDHHRGHPSFENPPLPRPRNRISIHGSRKKLMPRDMIRPRLQQLGWSEEYLRARGYVR